MTPDEIDEAKKLLWKISNEQSLSREVIKEVVVVMRRLLNSYQGTVKKMYKLRQRLRGGEDEGGSH